MITRRSWLVRGLLITALTLPLLGGGSCLQITQDALIHGFFDATTPLLVEQLEERLSPTGADAASAGDDSTGNGED